MTRINGTDPRRTSSEETGSTPTGVEKAANERGAKPGAASSGAIVRDSNRTAAHVDGRRRSRRTDLDLPRRGPARRRLHVRDGEVMTVAGSQLVARRAWRRARSFRFRKARLPRRSIADAGCWQGRAWLRDRSGREHWIRCNPARARKIVERALESAGVLGVLALLPTTVSPGSASHVLSSDSTGALVDASRIHDVHECLRALDARELRLEPRLPVHRL